MNLHNWLRNHRNHLQAAMLLTFLLVSSLTPVIAQAQPAPSLTMEVWAGLDGICRENSLMPLRVRLENQGPSFPAVIEVNTVASGSDSTRYVQNVDLPTGSRKEIYFSIYPEGYLEKVRVSVRSGQTIQAEQETTPTCYTGNDLIFGVLSDQESVYNLLTQLDPPSGNAFVAQLQSVDLPEDPAALRVLDALFIGNSDTGALSKGQQQALFGWVASGGQLVVAGGSNWQATTAGLEDLLPVQVSGVETFNEWENVTAFAQSPALLNGEAAVTVSQPKTGAKVLLQNNDFPLIASQNLGQGRVIFLAFDPSQEPLRSWNNLASLFKQILSGASTRPSWSYGFINWDAANNAISTLEEDGPSSLLVFLFLGLYVLAVGPLNWILLRILKRRELAWVTIPAAVIVFSLFAFLLSGQARGGQPVLHRAAIVQVWPNSPVARVDGLVGLYAPNRASYDLTIEEGVSVHPIPFYPLLARRGGWIIQGGQGQPTLLKDLRLDVSGINAVAVEGVVPAPQVNDKLSLQLSPASISLKGWIENQTGLTLEDATFILGSEIQHLGNLENGERREVAMDLKATRAAPYYANPTNNSMGGFQPAQPVFLPGGVQTTDLWSELIGTTDFFRDRFTYRRYMLLNANSNMGSGSGSAAGGAYLAGWSSNSPIQASPNQPSFQTQDLTLYFFALEIPFQAQSGRLEIPPGLFTWQAIDPNPYGVTSPYDTYLQSVGYTLAFQPSYPIAFSRVEELRLNLQSYGSTGPSGLEISLWDWQQEVYIDQGTLDWGQHRLKTPEAYVSPLGEIRVKVAPEPSISSVSIERVDFSVVVQK